MLTLTAATEAQSAGLTAPTGMSVVAGYGNYVDVYGVEAHWDSFYSCSWLKDHGLDTHLIADIDQWRARRDGVANDRLVAIGLIPLLRWTANQGGIVRTYVEGGIGVRLLSKTQIDDRHMSTVAQFGERLGAGMAFGPHYRYEAGIFVQHVSNGSIKKPNSGLTYYGLSLGMRL